MSDQSINKEILEFNQEIEKSIKVAKANLKKKLARILRRYDAYLLVKLKKEIAKALSIELEEVDVRIPPSHVSGDFAIEIFPVAKLKKKNPKEMAEEAAAVLNKTKGYIEKAETAGPFLNISLNRKYFYNELLIQVLEFGNEYGLSDVHKKKIAVIDYSGPNVAKPIGVGHLRSTIIGQALKNIYEATGYSVVGDNHLGDWGTQFGKLLYAYLNWADKKKVEKNPIEELKNLYVDFNTKAKDEPDLNDKARELFKKLEAGDSEMTALWIKFVKLSILSFDKVYERLGVEFDTCIGESYFMKAADFATEECLKAKVAKVDKESGSVIVPDLDGLATFLLKKSDGSTLYMSRDLATIIFRVNEFKPNDLLYVVGSEQELNFKQLFALARKMKHLPASIIAKHIGFGMVLVEGVKMSTRKGTLVALGDLLDKSVEKSKEILREKNSDISEKQLAEISEAVGIGAIIYNDLRQGRAKNISFDWKRMLDFEAGSAVYLQYTYARIKSIIKKVGIEPDLAIGFNLESDIEFALAKKISIYPDILLRAQAGDSPHIICNYLEELTQLFNGFYNEISIVKTENKQLLVSRVALINCVATVIKNGMNLINIKTPERI